MKVLIPNDLRHKSNSTLLKEYEGLLKDAQERGDDVACKILRRYIEETKGA